MFQRRDNGGLDSRRGVEKWVGSRDAQNVKLVTPGDEVCMWRWEASGCIIIEGGTTYFSGNTGRASLGAQSRVWFWTC